MKKINHAFILLAFLTCNLMGQSEWEIFNPIREVNDIAFHDNKAYVATSNGLLIIDLLTYEEIIYNSDNSGLSVDLFTDVKILPNGHYWLVNDRVPITYYDGNGYSRVEGDLSSINWDFIRSLTIGDDRLWFVGDLSRIYSANGKYITKHDNLPGANYGIAFDNNDHLWIAGYDVISKVVNGLVAEEFDYPELEPNGKFHSYFYANGRIWLESSEQFPLGGFDYETRYHLHYLENNSWKKMEIPFLLEGEIFTENESQFSYSVADTYVEMNGSTFENYKIKELYPNIPFYVRDVTIIGKEAEDVFWVKTNTDAPELFRLSHINYINPNCIIDRVIVDELKCEYWGISGDEGCFSVWNIQDSTYREIDILPDDRCSAAAIGGHGDFYITCSNTLVKIDSIGLSSILEPPIIHYISFLNYSVVEDLLWVIGRDLENNATILSYKQGEWQNHITGYADKIDIVYEDYSGGFWIVDEDSRIFNYDGTAWNLYATNITEFSREINDIAVDKGNNLWIGADSGLYRYDGIETIKYDNSNSDMLSWNCREIEIAKDSILWIRHFHGLSQMKIDSLPTIATGTKKLNTKSAHFSLYPNPTHASFTLSFPHAEKRKIEIFIKASGASGIAVEKLVVY